MLNISAIAGASKAEVGVSGAKTGATRAETGASGAKAPLP
jgi:hypothetical protein